MKNIETRSVVKITNKNNKIIVIETISSNFLIFNLFFNKQIEKINNGSIFAKKLPNFFSSLKKLVT